jgi:hypothetical protein
MATQHLVAELTIDFGAIRTVTSAERAIIRAAVDLRWYGPTHPDADQWTRDLEALLLALTVTTGEQAPEILERMDHKIDRAFKRQEKESAEMAKRLGLI